MSEVELSHECNSCESIITSKEIPMKCLCGSKELTLLNAFKKDPIKMGQLNEDILNESKTVLRKYIDTSEENISLLSLWLIGTYFHSKFETFPLLYLNAQKRSGKTRTLKLLSSLAYNSDGSVNTSPTETYLFRHKEGALFFDEMENISSKERGAFRETLNAVYKRGNKIVRYKEKKTSEGTDYVEDCFYPYYPLALANIYGVGDVLSDRSVQIVLQRSSRINTKLIEDFRTNKEILSLKKKLEALNASIPKEFSSEWNNYIQKLPIENDSLLPLFEKMTKIDIGGRALEIFLPLLIIAHLCNSLDDFLIVAKEYVSKKEEEEQADDFDEILKEFLLRKAKELGGEYVSLAYLLNAFRLELEGPEDWINPKWFGRAIKRLGLISNKRRVNGKVQIILKNNATNTPNTINSINTTNTTKEVAKVEFDVLVDKKGPSISTS